MKEYIAGFQFIRNVLGKKVKNLQHEVIEHVPGCDFIEVYTANNPSPLPFIVFHGMNKHGAKDERIQNFAKNIAATGYTVFIPQIRSFCEYIIDIDSQSQDMRDIVGWVLTQKQYCPQGKVCIFTPSFASAPAIPTITDPNLADKISRVLFLGPYFYIDAVLKNLFFDKTRDQYARLITFKNICRQKTPDDKALLTCLDRAIDNIYDQQNPNDYVQALKQLPQEQQRRVESIVNITYDPDAFYQQYEEHFADYQKHYQYTDRIKDIQAEFFLLHSATDNIFSPSESQELHQALLKEGKKSRLIITKLLDHADLTVNFQIISQGFKLWLFFSSLLRQTE